MQGQNTTCTLPCTQALPCTIALAQHQFHSSRQNPCTPPTRIHPIVSPFASPRLASSVAPFRALSLSPSSVTEMSNSRPRCPSTATTNGLPGNLFGFASKEFSYSRASSPLRCRIRAMVTRPHYPYHAHRTLYCSPYMLIAAPALQRQVPRRASTKHRLQYAIDSRLPLLFYGSCAYCHKYY